MKYKLDKDGNQILDEGGNPIEVVEETLTPAEELDKVKAENATLLQTKETLVTEVQDLRKKKQLTEEEKDTLTAKVAELEGIQTPDEPKETPDVTKVVEALFTKNKQESVKKNMGRAMNTFIAKHPELSPANDEAGLKKAAFDRKLAIFNTSSLEDESDFLSIFEDTYKLLDNKETVVEAAPGVPNTPGSSNLPKSEGSEKLTTKELNYVNKNFKGDVKRFLELKEKYPDAVPNLQ